MNNFNTLWNDFKNQVTNNFKPKEEMKTPILSAIISHWDNFNIDLLERILIAKNNMQ